MSLHTGDFRASPALARHPLLARVPIHTLFLDTTYCDDKYDFPAQDEVVAFAVAAVTARARRDPRTCVVVGTYTIGKERVFVAIAKALGCKVHVAPDKFKVRPGGHVFIAAAGPGGVLTAAFLAGQVLQCLGDPELMALLTSDPALAKVHVVPLNQVRRGAVSAVLGPSRC